MLVFITGEHRTGTSALAGALEGQGVPFGPADRIPHPHNPTGHYGNPAVDALNQALLGVPELPEPTHTPRSRKPAERDHTDLEAILDRYDGPFAGIKDPDFLFALPVWLQHVSNIWLIATFRHPARVIKSAAARRGDEGRPVLSFAPYEHWRLYYERLLEVRRRVGFPVFNFDALDDGYFAQLRSVAQTLGLTFDEPAARSFIRQDLVHQRDDEPLPQTIKVLYDELVDLSRQPVQWQPLTIASTSGLWEQWSTARDETSELLEDLWHDRLLFYVEALVEVQRLQAEFDRAMSVRDLEIERLQALVEEAVAVRDAEITRLRLALDHATFAQDPATQSTALRTEEPLPSALAREDADLLSQG